MLRPLTIAADPLAAIRRAAVAADRDECLGLLAAPPHTGTVTAAYRLPATASPHQAEAAPAAIARMAAAIEAAGLAPIGLWHSHGHLPVYHSPIDRDTIERLLPAMAATSFAHPDERLLPALVAPDTAVLPLRGGDIATYAIAGPPIPGLAATEAARWTTIATHFAASWQEPRAELRDTCLIVGGAGVVLTLGLPPAAALTVRRAAAPARRAHLYSLVTNARGDTCAACLVMVEFNGEALIQHGECPIIVAEQTGRGDGGGAGWAQADADACQLSPAMWE